MTFRVIFSIFFITAAAAGAPITSLYFFGDSLSDTGNLLSATTALNRYTLGLVPVQPPAPYATGRFTNGPVWAEHTASRLGHAEDAKPAGLDLGIFGQIGGDGNNYAIAGSRTDDRGALGPFDFLVPTGMAHQVDFYLSRTAGAADPGGLYFLFSGGNELQEAARIPDPTQRMLVAQRAGANIAHSVRDLYLAGARNFVLINSADIGLIPNSIADGVTQAGTDAAVQFNTYLGLYADYLRNSVPEFSLYFFDLFGLHHELVDEYGMGALRPCISEPGTCGERLFFDGMHPTAWAHEIIGNRVADEILGGVPSEVVIPEPSSTLMTLSAAAVLLLARRRRIGRS